MSVYRNILVPIDGSPTLNRGLIEAIELTKNQPATLRLVHVLKPATMDELGAVLDRLFRDGEPNGKPSA